MALGLHRTVVRERGCVSIKSPATLRNPVLVSRVTVEVVIPRRSNTNIDNCSCGKSSEEMPRNADGHAIKGQIACRGAVGKRP
jgi:hypothetical protein